MNVIPISELHLVFSTVLVLFAGLVSALLRLGLLRSLAWGAARTFVQLLLVGYVLTHVFAVDHPALVAAIVALMCLLAARASLQRLSEAPERPFGLAVLSLGASTFLVGTLVCGVVIGGERWYAARLVIPIAGMILGNSLNGISLALDRMYGEMRARSREVETRLSLGYSNWEAVRPHVRTALRAGMTPTINALMVVGIVSLPGMMTGQILAGADPMTAVRYQIVVMMMIAASVTLGSLLVVGLSFRRCFTDEDTLRPELRG
jgi:putative ABC transport system permease protein